MAAQNRALQSRRADPEDREWLFDLFRFDMKDYIQQTWGWDELIQRESFMENLPPSSFHILSRAPLRPVLAARPQPAGEKKPSHKRREREARTGAYCLRECSDHLWLEMLLIVPACQRQGLGTQVIRQLQNTALDRAQPIRLSVLRVNPALRLYQRLGFRIDSTDRYSYRLVWRPDADVCQLRSPAAR